MGPVFRRYLALHFLLDAVVSDGLRRVDGSPEFLLCDFTDRTLGILRSMPEPHAGVTIGLQLEPDGWRGGSRTLPAALHPLHGADQVLDVMAEFMGQDVRLSCVAALRVELAGQLIEEFEIEVDRGVGWAIERPGSVSFQ